MVLNRSQVDSTELRGLFWRHNLSTEIIDVSTNLVLKTSDLLKPVNKICVPGRLAMLI